jgi:hypothetical protein
MGLAILTSVLTGTGGLENGLSTTFLVVAAALILFGAWARRIPARYSPRMITSNT